MTPVSQQLPENLILKSGSHEAASREMCVMEALSITPETTDEELLALCVWPAVEVRE